MIYKNKIIISIASSVVLVFLISSPVKAEYNQLPELLHGQTTITIGGVEFYGGLSGNFAVINFDPNLVTASNFLGLNESMLHDAPPAGCYGSDWSTTGPNPCYQLDPSTTSTKLLTSRSVVNGQTATETAAILWPDNSIIGDAYSSGDYLSNFAFYGRNLNQNSSSTLYGQGATWTTKDYALNKEAQASYQGDQQAYYQNRINLMSGEGQTISVADLISNPNWNLQGGSGIGNPQDVATYPEGRVWSVVTGDVNITTSKTYRGKGTIVINGNLTLGPGVSIQPPPNSNSDFLGIIVKGNLIFSGRNRTQMANFTTGDIIIGGNGVEAYGSYVARDFQGTNNHSGIRFTYDYRLDSGWPPGFRYFNMPTAKNSAP